MRALFLLTWWVMGSALAQDGVGPERIEIPLGVEVGLHGSYLWAHGEGGDYCGPGARLHVLLRLGSHVALGPEVALYAHAGSYNLYHSEPAGETYDLKDAPLFQVGGLMKIGGDLGPTHPSLLVGLGWYKGGVYEGLGVSLGAEVEVHLVKDWFVAPLVRYHLSRFVGPELGLGVHWKG